MGDFVQNLSHKKLLTVNDFCEYISIGQAQARKIITNPNCPFSLKIGHRWFVNRTFLDEWLDEKTQNKENIN